MSQKALDPPPLAGIAQTLTLESFLIKSENILKPDFCPQINVDISFASGGLILHNNKLCVSKKLDKNSFLYKSFNVSKNKKQ